MCDFVLFYCQTVNMCECHV